MGFVQLHWSQKAAYGLVAAGFVNAPVHFALPNESNWHVLLFGLCTSLTVGCMILGLQTQPREMRPALFAFLGLWVHVGMAYLSQE